MADPQKADVTRWLNAPTKKAPVAEKPKSFFARALGAAGRRKMTQAQKDRKKAGGQY